MTPLKLRVCHIFTIYILPMIDGLNLRWNVILYDLLVVLSFKRILWRRVMFHVWYLELVFFSPKLLILLHLNWWSPIRFFVKILPESPKLFSYLVAAKFRKFLTMNANSNISIFLCQIINDLLFPLIINHLFSFTLGVFVAKSQITSFSFF